jgi:hypothetical protein
MLLALLRGAKVMQRTLAPLDRLLPNIVNEDGRNHPFLSEADLVLLNPPYGRVMTPDGVPWTSGLVTDAALWVATVVEHIPRGAQLAAVLPDVLRSGSRYSKWRRVIARSVRIEQLRSVGQFDALTDVDVFVLVAKRGARHSSRGWPEIEAQGSTLEDFCSVMVGAVVDLRDAHDGPWVPYITTRDLPQRGEFVATQRRRFAKRLFEPPFVVVRRTSRPSAGQARLRPVIIRGSHPVAVENHLLVLQPKRQTLRACRGLRDVLVAPTTTDWLDQRIRTRHLTVASVREIPLTADAGLLNAV